MTQKFGYGYDWRGVALFPGQTVIYGAGVGRSIAMVEAEIVSLYPSPDERVKLKVVHRAYGGSSVQNVTVGQDRVTVVEKLPPAAIKETVEEKIARDKIEEQKRKECEATHNFKPRPKYPDQNEYQDPYPIATVSKKLPYSAYRDAVAKHGIDSKDWYNTPCVRCNTSWYDTRTTPCPG